MVTLGRVTYPTIVDDPTKSLIFDWFQYREVCDNEKFNVFFNRTLNAAMRKYRQLLRIQPGETIEFEDGETKLVNYDWMIQTYHELQHTTEEDIDVAETTSGTNTVARDNREVTDGVVTTTGRDRLNKNTTAQSTGQTDVTSENYNKHQNNLTDRTQDRFERDLTDKNTADMHHNTSNDSNDKTLGKAAPQSQSYLGTSGMPTTLDWQYPGSQGETKHTDAGDTHDNGYTQDRQTGFTTDDQTTNHTGWSDDAGNGKSKNISSNSGFGTEDSTTNINRQTMDDTTKTSESSEQGSSNVDKNGYTSHDTLHREMMQGRNLDIATILENAKNFILGSSAWDFLYGEIDKCFISIYND